MNTMTTFAKLTWHRIAAVGFTLAIGLGCGAPAALAEELDFVLPAVIASAALKPQMDAVFYPYSLVPTPHYAFARDDSSIGGIPTSSSAQAAATLDGFMVMAHQSAGLAVAEAYMEATVEDPQQRPEVKLNLRFKASATSAGGAGRADWNVKIGFAANSDWFVRTNSNGTISWINTPSFQPPALIEVEGIYVATEDGPGGGGVVVYRDGQVAEQRGMHGSAVDDRVIDITVRPGATHLMAILASTVSRTTSNSGVAVLDPVLLPHPDNPDVVVHVSRAAQSDPTPRAPLAGITPEQLVAEGIDIGPLQDLGFFDTAPPPPPPGADTTPPTTTPSATPAANAQGWNKTPVTITLSATDNVGGSGVKELHYSLDGAATGSQVVPGSTATVTVSAEGMTTLTFFAVDNAGNQETAKTVTVGIDQTPPTMSGLPRSCSLWPADHALVQVASVTANDDLSGVAGAPTVTATSNEPDSGTGDGDLPTDVVISGGTVQVRAERAGSGGGRVYTITATVSDLAGNIATQTATCNVPHDRARTARP